jgi:flagellar biosynthesis protein FlhG
MIDKIGNGIISKSAKVKNKKECQILAITSGKGGVGKSTISVNTAILLQKMRKKVLLIDADLHLGNVDLMLGLRLKHTLTDFLENDKSLEDIIVKGPGDVDVLPAASASLKLINTEEKTLRTLANNFSKLDHDYDIILIDTGAGISKTVISFLLGADKIIVIISPDPSSIADAYAVIKVVKSLNLEIPMVVVPNIVNSHEEAETIYKKMNLMVSKFLNSKIEYGGALLKDELIVKSIKKQRPFVLDYPNSVPTNALRILNRRILQISAGDAQDSTNLFNRFLENRKIDYSWND